MKEQEIICQIISDEMPDIEQIRENCHKQNAISTQGKKHPIGRIVLITVLTVLILSVSIAAADQLMRNGFLVNNNNQTYGTIRPPQTNDDFVVSGKNTPDLIAAVGIDGTEGYVCRIDLDGEQPNNPEEAIEYMEQLNERIVEMKLTGEKYIRIIPLYAEDGETIIGEFGISPGTP